MNDRLAEGKDLAKRRRRRRGTILGSCVTQDLHRDARKASVAQKCQPERTSWQTFLAGLVPNQPERAGKSSYRTGFNICTEQRVVTLTELPHQFPSYLM